MNVPRPKLDIDTTRERLVVVGCSHAAEHVDQVLSDAVRQEIAPHAFLDVLLETELSGREARRVKTSLKLCPRAMLSTIEATSAKAAIVTSCLVSFSSWTVSGDFDSSWAWSIPEMWPTSVAMPVEVTMNSPVPRVTFVFM